MSHTIELSLTGLTCGHCVSRVKQNLEQRADVIMAEVTLDRARITGSASAQALIDTIEQAGYQASLCSPKSDPLAVSGMPEALTADNASIPVVATPQIPPVSDTQAEQSVSQQLLISDMHCASCVARVQHALAQVAGVSAVQVNLAQRSAWVTGNAETGMLISALQSAGYQGEVVQDSHWQQRRQQTTQAEITRYGWQAALALVVGVPMMLWGMFGNAMMLTAGNRHSWLALGILTLLVMALAGRHYYRNAWKSLLNRTATMDSLVALGTAAAWLYSISVNLWPQLFPVTARHLYYEACLMIIGLINLGHLLESRGRNRSSKALDQLMNLTPAVARQVTEHGDIEIALSTVQPGMLLRLIPGDRVPVDGEITDGEAWIDEAMLTGEPGAQHKQVGDKVSAGTLTEDGYAQIRAQFTGKATTLARIIQLVQQAQSSKPAIGRLADRIAEVFVPVVILIAVVSGAIWYFFGPQPQIAYSLVISTTVLIIACPCALGLATPMSTIAGVARAAEYGILVRDADALQHASKLDTLVFDKTGTLTEGKPQVVSISTVDNFPPEQALQLAATLEQASGHPLARAIMEKAGQVSVLAVSDLRTLPGYGMTGKVAGVKLLLGSPGWLGRQQIDTGVFAEEITREAGQGATTVLLAADGKLLALFAIRDPLRSDTVTALQRLRQAGYRLIMLTGDSPLTASTVATEAGISEVFAGVLPDGKAQVISSLQEQGQRVAMIGDGINDAPALAQAQVSIAMAGGSDVAMETASITLMRHNLHALADALAIAQATLRNMRQSLFGAFIYNIIAIPVAAGILWPLTGTLLNPIIAGAAMALSSITVVANANRLLRFKPH